MRTTHVYMLIGDGWAYPGRSMDPSKRLIAHLAGKCKTTAPRIATDGVPPIMVPMEAYDFDLDNAPEANGEARLLDDMRAGEYTPDDFEVIYAIYPYYSKESQGRMRREGSFFYDPAWQAKMQRRMRRNKIGIYDPAVRARALAASQTPEARAKMIATSKRRRVGFFDPIIRAAGQAAGSPERGLAAAHSSDARAKAVNTQRKNKSGIFDPAARKKALASNRKNKTAFFDPVVQAQGQLASRTPEALLKATETKKRKGTGFFDPVLNKRIRAMADPVKGYETNNKNGTGICAPGVQAKASAAGLHSRWHTRRNLYNRECKLCIAEKNAHAQTS